MSKRKDKRQTAQLFSSITERLASVLPMADALFAQEDEEQTHVAHGHSAAIFTDDLLALSKELAQLIPSPDSQPPDLPKMKKFRFQLLHQWMTAHLLPCRVADVGGGKGLLAWLLQESGWSATVIDPVHQSLPSKYKDLRTNKQIRIASTERVPHLDQPFCLTMTPDFDLLVAMHAHGCNIQLIDAAAAYGRRLILLPCCIIQEPLLPLPDVHWIQCVVDYALHKELSVEPFRLNFKGQNIGLYLQPSLTV